MVQRGAAVYEEGSHVQKLYYSFTYCILCHVKVVCAYNYSFIYYPCVVVRSKDSPV